MKKLLIILKGPEAMKADVADLILKNSPTRKVELFGDVLAEVASLTKLSPNMFTDHELKTKQLTSPVSITERMLSRFSSRLLMGVLPSNWAGASLDTPEAILNHFLIDIGEKRWGKDWAAERFWRDYAYFRGGVSLSTDAEPFVELLRKKSEEGEILAIGIVGKNSESPKSVIDDLNDDDSESTQDEPRFDSSYLNGVDMVIEHSSEPEKLRKTVFNMLNDIKNTYKGK
jgi:hypothetical protein